MVGGVGQGFGFEVKEINGKKFIVQVLQGVLGCDLFVLIDEYKVWIEFGVVLLIVDVDGKVVVVVGVIKDLMEDLNVVDIVCVVVVELGGKGGGGCLDMV